MHNSQINYLLLNPDVGKMPCILRSLFNGASLMVFILCGRHSVTAVVQKEQGERKGWINIHRNWHTIMMLEFCNSNKTHIKWIKHWLTDLKKLGISWDLRLNECSQCSLEYRTRLNILQQFHQWSWYISLNTICEWHQFSRMVYNDEDWACKKKSGMVQERTTKLFR